MDGLSTWSRGSVARLRSFSFVHVIIVITIMYAFVTIEGIHTARTEAVLLLTVTLTLTFQ